MDIDGGRITVFGRWYVGHRRIIRTFFGAGCVTCRIGIGIVTAMDAAWRAVYFTGLG